MRKSTTILFSLIFVFILSHQVWGQYSGAGTFTKITSIDELTDGYYVVAYGTTFAMNNTNAGSYFGNTAITPSSNVITNPATTIVWKIQTHVDGGRTIYNENSSKYVSYTGSSNAAYAVDAVTSGSQRWTFAWSSTVFTVTNVTSTTRLLQYNTSSPRFACYTGSQQNITLYKMASTGSTPPTLTAASSPTVDASFDITFTEDATWRLAITTVKYGSNILTLNTDYTTSSGKITLIPSGSSGSGLRTAGTQTVTITATGYTDATVSQTINPGAPTSNSTSSIDVALGTGVTRTITCTAKDQYNNLASGYTFKYDATITDNNATTDESYTIDGTPRTSSVSNIDLTTTTNVSGVATFTVVMPSTVDANDGISIQVQLSDGTTNIGSAFSFTKQPPQITLTGIDPGSSSYQQNATGNVLYRIKVDVLNDNSTLSQLNAISGGNYLAADIQNSGLKLWYSSDATFSSSDDENIGSLSSSSTGTGEALSFTGLSKSFSVGTAYLFITADISSSATPGRTISSEVTANNNFTFSGSATFSGSSFTSANLHTVLEIPLLMISEYIEGSSNNKAIELYNASTEVINLADYVIFQFNNGATRTTGTRYALTLSGNLNAGETYTIANSLSSSEILALADLSTNNSVLNFNGDDALAIYKATDVSGTTINENAIEVDIFGKIGEDPGSYWNFGGVQTQDRTLRRKNTIY